jgi:thiol-disulfide isomerase/thioredoxin
MEGSGNWLRMMSKTLTEKNNRKKACVTKLILLMLLSSVLLAPAGCDKRSETLAEQQDAQAEPNTTSTHQVSKAVPDEPEESNVEEQLAAKTDEIPRFAINSPFKEKYESPVPEKGKRLWAKSFLWDKAPELVVEKWLTDKPDTTDKYTLIEFWATWCGPCRLSIPKLNHLHQKFGEELVIIAISEQKEEDVRKFKEPKIEYFSAIDTQKRMKEKLGVFGIPHVIIVEPNGYVVWEGFPLLKDYELTEEVVEKILSVGRKKQSDTFVSK